MKNKELPTEYTTVMVTYKKTFRSGPYGEHSEKHVVTEKGFYCPLFENFSIPPSWRPFKIGGEYVSLPHGFGGYHLKPSQIIEWKPIPEK